MKVFVLLAAVLGTALAANLDKTPQPHNGLPALLTEKGGVQLGTRIVGGVTTPIKDVPYIVALLRNSGLYCGGSIITASKILTAVHCTITQIILFLWIPIPESQFTVRAGSNYSETGGQLKQVERIVRHPQFNLATLNNDVAILFLQTPLDLSLPEVNTIPMPVQNYVVDPGTSALVAGWGALSENGPISDTLQSVTVSIVANPDCNTAYGGGITDNMICAGFLQEEADSCQGDSGGPLVVDGLLVGSVSFGKGCAREAYPGVYARISVFSAWIDSN